MFVQALVREGGGAKVTAAVREDSTDTETGD